LACSCFQRKRSPCGRFLQSEADTSATEPLIVTPKKKGAPHRYFSRIGEEFVKAVAAFDGGTRFQSRGRGFRVKGLAVAVAKKAGVKRALLKKFGVQIGRRAWEKGAEDNVVVETPRKRKGCYSTVPDKDLEAALSEECSASSRFHEGRSKMLMTLRGSLRQCFGRSGLAKKISYRQLCRRTSVGTRPRLAIGRGRKRVDVCSTCQCWDTTVSRTLKQNHMEVQRTAKEKCHNYFDRLDELLSTRDVLDKKGDVSDVRYMSAFKFYLERRSIQLRAVMDEASYDALAMTEAVCLEAHSKDLGTLEKYAVHWQLRDILHAQLIKDKNECPAGTLCVLMDYKDSL